MLTIISPVTGKNNVELIKEISLDVLVGFYKKKFNIDVKNFFPNNGKLYLYKCIESGYRFFYPSVEGDGNFYAQLQNYPWYYSDWKWENETALKFIKNGDKVLDVGSAKGSFIKHLMSNGNNVIGLETNSRAAAEARLSGVNVYEEHLDIFVKRGINDFDVVCFFQVLEHIYDVKQTIEDTLTVLKTGGKLIISVPNNSSFIGLDKEGYLNMPPHHAGLWDEKSLVSLTKIFGIKLISLEFEPLQKYHFNYYFNIKIGYFIQEKFGVLGKIFNRAIVLILTPLFILFRNKIKGHTILAVYQKL